MFGNLTYMMPAVAQARLPPKDLPPPTPINLPRCYPQVPDSDPNARESAPGQQPPKPLTALLQGIVRPTEVSISHLEALGAHVVPDASPAELIPDPAFIPDFEAWHALSTEEVHATNESTRRRLNTGNLSPGCQTYLERRRELSISNEAAYRTVRRLPAPKGQSQARLGNAYEFYRHLELFTAFWEDTARPPKPERKAEETDVRNGDSAPAVAAAAAEGNKTPESGAGSDEPQFYRTGSGNQMPADYRQNMVTAFLKLVAYDFTCNVTMPRTEPRLHLTCHAFGAPRSSYFTSGCTFIFRSPATREAARAGIVEGPLAAVSARNTTSFPPAPENSTGQQRPPPPGTATDRESVLDLARELVAALITAQHRAREGRTEKRVGENAWWATKPRWGGGPGGPIGREVEMQSGGAADETLVGDKDGPPPERPVPLPAAAAAPSSPSPSPGDPAVSLARRPFFSSSSRPGSLPTPSSAPGGSGSGSSRDSSSASASSSNNKGAKRLKKSGNHPMYDNYRMVRPPAATWDKKTRYAAIGRARGADYDDIFVVSSLLHHVSIVRVRVPDRLLAVLEGEEEDDGRRSWGRLEVWRSPWFDFFRAEDRVRAMQLVWSMMAWIMREVEGEEKEGAEGKGRGQGQRQGQGQDVAMTGA